MTHPFAELKALIRQTDVEDDPLLVSDGAKFLAEIQRWKQEGASLEKRVAAWVRSRTAPRQGHDAASLADLAYEVLLDEGAAMRYREIAAVIKARGFRHAREPKNPDRQLADSVWTAMYEDDRFVKVGRGIFDLRERA